MGTLNTSYARPAAKDGVEKHAETVTNALVRIVLNFGIALGAASAVAIGITWFFGHDSAGHPAGVVAIAGAFLVARVFLIKMFRRSG